MCREVQMGRLQCFRTEFPEETSREAGPQFQTNLRTTSFTFLWGISLLQMCLLYDILDSQIKLLQACRAVLAL